MTAKACSRKKPLTGERCGELFEGSGSYCRECRNEYMRAYHKQRKDHPLDAPGASLSICCACCDGALRNNTINIVQVVNEHGHEERITLCSTCKAAVKYLSETLTETQQEYLISLSMELGRPEESPKPRHFKVPSAARGGPVEPESGEARAERLARRKAEEDAYWAEVAGGKAS